MTLAEIINNIIAESGTVFGINETLALEEMPRSFRLDFSPIKNYNAEIKLNELSLKHYKVRSDITDGYEEHFGFFIDRLNIPLNKYAAEFEYFDFENSGFPELESFASTFFQMMNYFYTYGLYETSLFGYLILSCQGKTSYNDETMRKFYLTDVSESPAYVSAIEHFSVKTSEKAARIVFNDYGETMETVFGRLIRNSDFTEFLSEKFPADITGGINEDISRILSLI